MTQTTKQSNGGSVEELLDHLYTTDAEINPEHANQIMKMAYQFIRCQVEERKLMTRIIQ